MNIHDRWEAVTNEGGEFLEFHKVNPKRSQRPDLHAFLMLDELFPSDRDIVSNAAHDQIWLDMKDEEIESLTDEQMIELSRCGVFHDEDGGLSMFA